MLIAIQIPTQSCRTLPGFLSRDSPTTAELKVARAERSSTIGAGFTVGSTFLSLGCETRSSDVFPSLSLIGARPRDEGPIAVPSLQNEVRRDELRFDFVIQNKRGEAGTARRNEFAMAG